MLFTRMLLSRPPRGGHVPKKQLEDRFQMFSARQWAELISGSLALSATGSQAGVRRKRRSHNDDVHKRADRALTVLEARPEAFSLDEDLSIECLRSSRRGAAAGPSGRTADHLQPVLDTERDSSLFFRLATVLAKGQAPAAAVEGVRMGRTTALRKADGGVRGIVVGDILRRLVARTMAKQTAASVEAATGWLRERRPHPPEFDRSRRAGNDQSMEWVRAT